MKPLDDVRFLVGMRIKPFHNDRRLQAFVLSLLDSGKIEAFVETGTYRGATLSWVAARFSGPCYSCETQDVAFTFSTLRTLLRPNVTIVKEQSTKFMESAVLKAGCGLFWLDAHGPNFPLLEELRLIRALSQKAVVIIDDFDTGNPRFPFITIGGIKCDKALVRYVFEEPIYVPDYSPDNGKQAAGYGVIFRGIQKPIGAPLRVIE